MQHVRGKDRTPPGKRVERDASMFQKLEAELREEFSKEKQKAAVVERTNPKKDREPIGYCAYCGRPLLYDQSFRWMYDEDGQRVRKCKSLRACASKRKKNGQEESYRRAMALFNRPGGERWLDFESEAKDGRDE